MSSKINDFRPQTIAQAIEGMALAYDPAQGQTLSETIQFHVSGEGGGDWVLEIGNGRCHCRTGTAPNPSLTITTPAAVWLAIARKEKSGALALMTGKYKAGGNIGLLLKLDKIFSRQPSEAELAERGWLN
ncbi:MAG: SCP2 sterol-binding domain-containing protein [Anaerolineales bacterium]|nr:SCP2 sterol-binding domain-containing protein [Anaerolineales bacterium]